MLSSSPITSSRNRGQAGYAYALQAPISGLPGNSQPPTLSLSTLTGVRLLRFMLLPLITIAVGWADWVTGWEWSLFVLYAVPIMLGVWWGGQTVGLGLAFFGAVVWWVANRSANPYQTEWGYNLAMVSRLVYFLLAAFGGSAIRRQQESDRRHIEMLEAHRRLEQDFVAVSEFEQQRIGQDLHDGLCQQLAAVGCAARVLADELQARGLSEWEDAARIEEAVQQAAGEARMLARGIYPVHVDHSGLSAALGDLATTTKRLTGVDVVLEESIEVQLSDPEVSMHLYRIAQEAVANAMRHSGASRVVIGLRIEGDNLLLSITDNGRGISSLSSAQSDGMGMKTMRYRSQALGAGFSVSTVPSEGTTILCSLKVKPDLPEPTLP